MSIDQPEFSFTLSESSQRRYREILVSYQSIFHDALVEKCAEKIGDLAHKMKGNAQLYGFATLSELGKELMTEVPNLNWPRIEQLIAAVDKEINQAVSARRSNVSDF